MNPEGQPKPEHILEEQRRYANQVQTNAAGQELAARFAGFNESAVPQIQTEEERRQQAHLEYQINQVKAQLAQAQKTTEGLDPRLVHPNTKNYIDTLNTQLQELEAQIHPETQLIEPTDEKTREEGEYYTFTEGNELGHEKLKELYEQERELTEHYGQWLGIQDRRERQYDDRPRLQLRKDLIQNHLLPAFLLSTELRAVKELKERQNELEPEAVYKRVRGTISSVGSNLSRSGEHQGTYPIRSHDFNGEDNLGNDVFNFYLLCNNTDSGIHPRSVHAPQYENRVYYYQQWIAKEVPRVGGRVLYSYGSDSLIQSESPVGGSLDPLFEKYPEVAREVALIQAAEKATGETQSLFAESINPHYEIKEEDQTALNVLTAEFRAINEQRKAMIAEQQARVTELEHGIEMSERLKSQLERAQRTLEDAKAKFERAQQLANTTERPGLFNFADRRRYNEVQADFASARQYLATAEQTVVRLEETVGRYATQYREVHDILEKYGLYRSNDTDSMNSRLNVERQRLQLLESFIPKENNELQQ